MACADKPRAQTFHNRNPPLTRLAIHRDGERREGQLPAEDAQGHTGLYDRNLGFHAIVADFMAGSGTDVVLREQIFTTITNVFKYAATQKLHTDSMLIVHADVTEVSP